MDDGVTHRLRGPAALVATVAAAGGLMVMPGAARAVTVTDTLTTPTEVTSSTRSIIYYLQLLGGPTDERFTVRLQPPSFASRGPFDEGQSIDGPRQVALQGPGAVGAQVQDPSVMEPCSERDERFHGYATGAVDIDVMVPAALGTTLAVRFNTGRRAPWVDGDYRMRYALRPGLVGTYAPGSPFAAGPTPLTPFAVTTDGPTVGGRTGAHLVLSTTPAGTTRSSAAPRTVGRDTPIRVRGRVLPATGRRVVVLQYARSGGALRTLARVRTDAAGRFTAPAWRLGRPGTYELWARYPSQPGGLTADETSCPTRFRAR